MVQVCACATSTIWVIVVSSVSDPESEEAADRIERQLTESELG